MSKTLILGLGLALFAATAASAAPGKKAVKADPRAFDGKWSIEVLTERGDCDRAYRYGIRIENGQVRYDGGGEFNVEGRVSGAGAVKGSISRGESRADVVGALSGDFGKGTWATKGSSACGGSWNAEKRG